MGWTDPTDLDDIANGESVTAIALNRSFRDNMRSLFRPPRAMATNDATANVVKRGTVDEAPYMINFGRVLEDNFSMYAAGDQVDGWAPTVTMRTRVSGTYLIGAEVFVYCDQPFEGVLAITQRALGEPWPGDPPLLSTTGAQLAASANEHELSTATVLNLPADRVVAVALLTTAPAGVTVTVGASPSSPVFSLAWIGA